MSVLREAAVPELKLHARGKVRDIFDLGDRLLIVATDRISAFDCVLPTPIPDKGRVLTRLSLFWFEKLKDVVPHHLISDRLEGLGLSTAAADELRGRAMVVRKAKPLPVECIVRGYLAGSGWQEYQATGAVSGIRLEPGLAEAQRLDAPIFTPSTKAAQGHDENIPFARAARMMGQEAAVKAREASLALYTRAARHALTRGIIIADTKFEFGLIDGEVALIDEVLTPDSSRFWPVDAYHPGASPPSFDKQFVRDWLESESGWDKRPPAPPLPEDVVQKTREKYLEACRRLTGRPLAAPTPEPGQS